jgi:hypothetical protein
VSFYTGHVASDFEIFYYVNVAYTICMRERRVSFESAVPQPFATSISLPVESVLAYSTFFARRA